MILQVRSARPAIVLNGLDYYNQLAPYLESFTYTDNSDGKTADDLTITLADRDKKFISAWMPDKGAYVDASILAERWFTPFGPALSLDCGRFWIDTIEFALPDSKVTVKANSIPTDARIKGSKEHRGWDKTSLQDIAGQIAGENKMSLDWQADSNPRYGRTEQHDESPLSFLLARCLDAKLAIKIHRNKVVIFDEQKLEEKPPAFSLVYGDAAAVATGATYRMAGGHFTTKVVDTSKTAKVSAMNPETGELNEGDYKAPDEDVGEDTGDKVNHDTDADEGSGGDGGGAPPSGRTLEGTNWGEADASAGASLKAKSHVRQKNKDKFHGKIELSLGNPLIAAGQTFMISGCGQFDGKWFVESAHHKVGPEYTTELEARLCLHGY